MLDTRNCNLYICPSVATATEPVRDQGLKGMARAGLLALCAVLPLPAAGQSLSKGQLGANYNEHFEDVAYRDLEKAKAHWVRIFLPMPQVVQDPGKLGAIRTILEVGEHGYQTVLTLKWPYLRRDFPKRGSPEMERELTRLDQVLPLVMGKVDILVIGNEPYLESREEDRDRDLNAFYETMAARLIEYRKVNCGAKCKTHLYMGALNRLDLKAHQTPSTERWMAYVKATPEIDGVDIHPHVSSLSASKPFLGYILPRMRPEQTFIVTEFSLTWWWQKNMKRSVNSRYASMYHIPPDTQNWQVIKTALDAPVPKSKWDDFLRLSPWFETKKHYLRNQMKMFRDTGRLAVATFGFKQGSSMSADWGPNKTPWLVNSVFAGRTIRANADGSAAANYAWLDDFRALQAD